jgi:phospho-N-acetylmuramoyl-pentapeptide-transferase
VVKRRPKGLVGRYKLVGQMTLGLGLGAYLYFNPLAHGAGTLTSIPFAKGLFINFGPLFVLLVALVVTGTSNAVNLSDGIDGLAIGLSAFSFLAFAGLSYLSGHRGFSDYLNIMYLEGSGELAVFCMSVVGAALGFLWYNAHPAQVFMGDTGSLALGGALGIIAVLIHQPLVLVIAGGVFVMEAGSVILQTGWYRFTRRRFGTGRRIFLMAPIHHHFEKRGWYESQVVMRFYILGILCAVVALSTLKIR